MGIQEQHDAGRPIPLAADLYALVRMPHDLDALLQRHLFSRYPHREWASFFLFGYRKVSWGIVLTVVDLIPPKAGDLDRSSGIVNFRTQYIARAKDIAETTQLALGVAHSHPQGCLTSPSRLDNDMDRYFAEFLEPFLPGRPYASLILEKSSGGTFNWSGRAFDHRGWMSLRELFTTSAEILTRVRNQLMDSPLEEPAKVSTLSPTARADELFGRIAARRIRCSCIGVVGASGTGSPAIEILARAGVGEIVVIDPKRLDRSNQERLHGSNAEDYLQEPPPWKVDIAARHVSQIAPAVKVTKIVGNILEDRVLDELVRCDVILGCSDTYHSRAAYSYLSNHYYLPVFDMGVRMYASENRLRVQSAEFISYWPGGPCPYCDDRIDWREVAQELASPEEANERRRQAEEALAAGLDGDQYWRNSPRLLTVGYLTTLAGSLAAGYVLHWLTGAAEMPASRFQIDVGYPELGFVCASREIKNACTCRSKFGWNDQGASERLVRLA